MLQLSVKLVLVIGLAILVTGCATNNNSVPYNETASYKDAVYKAEQRKIVGSKEYIEFHERLAKAKAKRIATQNDPEEMKKLKQDIAHSNKPSSYRPDVYDLRQTTKTTPTRSVNNANNQVSESYNGRNTVQCTKFGDISFGKQIYTFNGSICPLGYIQHN